MSARARKESQPVLAICYDFDKTLSPDNMQAQGFLQAIDYEDQDAFWKEVMDLAVANEMDTDLAWMYKMVKDSHGKLIPSRTKLKEYGESIELNPGVEEWFERINEYGAEHGVIVEHYIISSGIREMIEGTKPAREGAFAKIYASSFLYDDAGVAVWPAQVINYTNKTQYLFRISKGVLDVTDRGVNDKIPNSEMRVPFRNMVYIGDSDTDVPCMKLVNSYGGHAIGVYDPTTGDKCKVQKMLRDNRIKYYAPADYREDTELDKLIKTIIRKTRESEKLEEISWECEIDN